MAALLIQAVQSVDHHLPRPIMDDLLLSEDEDTEAQDAEIGDEEEELQKQGLLNAPQTTACQSVHRAMFAAWKNDQVKAAGEADLLIAAPQNADIQTLRALMASQQTQVITNPRDYQMELFERAKAQNTIAVLDTGSGKTLIAVLLLRYVIDQELEDRKDGKSPRISFFLVDKVTLVFQQFAVLEANLDHKAERFCGAMGCDLWTKDFWAEHFKSNKVIVCTADVLVHCLMHSFITISQINLLIFDEAHHAKKGHAYARIIKDFYLDIDRRDRRPRIFGMTASPIDVRVRDDVVEKARELEALLDCRIATTSDLSLLRATVSRPIEQILHYTRLSQPFVTPLHQDLKNRFWDLEDFRRLFEHAEAISGQLGRWCSDAYWSFAFSDREAKKYEARAERRHTKVKSTLSVDIIDKEVALLREAQAVIEGHAWGKPQVTLDDLSSKILKLYEYLQLYFEKPTDTRCLVFVERKHTARLLKIVFDHLGGPNLKAGTLLGSNAVKTESLQTNFKQQVTTLVKFRSGELNCLFATSVAEEGLDIQDCNIVIRFDLCKTMIQYVQSRGRARHKNSKFVHLVESGNTLQEDGLRSINKSEIVMRRFCEQIPEDRLLDKQDSLERALVRERAFRSYTDKATGAKLNYDCSLVVLAHFVSALPHDEEDDASIIYIVSAEAGKFKCEVILPGRSPIRSAVGRAYAKKSSAKRSAAWEACMMLRKGNYLDANLLPIYINKAPAMRNAHLALHSKTLTAYPMQLKPKFWEYGRGSLPHDLFLTVIYLADAWDHPVRPIGLVSRVKPPVCPPFPIFRLTGESCTVLVTTILKSFEMDLRLLERLTTFTLRYFKDLFNKEFDRDLEVMPYWLAPLVELPGVLNSRFDEPLSLLDHNVLSATDVVGMQNWNKEMPNEVLVDKFFVDPLNGGKRYFTKAIAHDLKPTDFVPEELKGDSLKVESILLSTISEWKNTRQRKFDWCNKDQPVLVARKTGHRLDVLATAQQEQINSKLDCVICPEPLHISPLPTGLVSMGYLFPAIVYRMECYWTSLELCELLGLTSIGPALALEALTKDADNTDNTQEAPVNFQRGMGPNYERLEFIGDCFLKMATSISLFTQFIGQNEDEMHVFRMCMICNKNMFLHAKQGEYFRYIRSLAFSRRTWYPPGLKLVKGKGAGKEERATHVLGDKTIADVCEALIGASLMTRYTSGYDDPCQFDEAVRAVSIFVKSDDHLMKEWGDYLKAYTSPASWLRPPTASQSELVRSLQTEHDYVFRLPLLARSAFQHPSYPRSWENIPSYQRLEFLGDALLDMACVMHLVNNYSNRDPQWLTEHKMAMVSNKFLGAVCVRIGFHRHLHHNSSIIGHHIMTYVEEIQTAEEDAQGARDYWMNARDPPKCLPDVVEAYIGAIFVDSGFQYKEVQRFFDHHIKWFFEDMSIYDVFASHHPTTRLHNFLSINMGCHNYRLMSDDISDVDGTATKVLATVSIHGTMVGRGQAASSKNAKIIASDSAYKEIEGLAPYEFRLRYACGCKMSAGEAASEVPSELSSGPLEEMIGTAI